jgi:chromosomal replication initiation ATPase DnaA
MSMIISPYIIAGLKRTDMPKTFIEITPDDWVNAVCGYIKIDFKELDTKCREDQIVYGRQLICFLLSRNTKITLKKIVLLFNNAITHHTTVMNARKQIQNQLDIKNEKVIHDLEQIIKIAKENNQLLIKHHKRVIV